MRFAAVFDQCLVRYSMNIFLGFAGGRPRLSNDEFVLRVRDCQDLYACMSCLSVQCLVLNFVSADCRKWLHQKYCSTSTHFQYLSAIKVIFLVFTSTNHYARNRNPEMVMGRTERNLHSYMAEFIKLVNGYNTFSTGTKVSRQ